MKLFTARQPSREMTRQKERKHAFDRTDTLQAGPINQEDNDCFRRGCFDPPLSAIASSPIFWEDS